MTPSLTTCASASTASTGWSCVLGFLDEQGHAVTRPLLTSRECSKLAEALRGRPVQSDDRHGTAPLWRRALPIFRPSPARKDRRAAQRVLVSPRADRERLGLPTQRREPDLTAGSCRAPRALSCCWTATPDVPDPAVPRGRLERPAPGPLRRRLTPLSGADDPGAPGRRLRRRGVRAPRTTAASTEPRECAPALGSFVIFPTRERPHRGNIGRYASACVTLATVTRGERTALGMIIHDAA